MHTPAKPSWGATRTGARTSAQHRRLERALGTLERAAERAAEVVAEALATTSAHRTAHRAEQAWIDGAQSGFTDFGARLAALRRSLADERARRDPAALTGAIEALEAARAWCESAEVEALAEAAAAGEGAEGVPDDEVEAERHHALGRAAALAEAGQQLSRLAGPRARGIRRPNVQTFRRPLPRRASIRQSTARDRRLPSA